MTHTGDPIKRTENLLDIVGGGVLILLAVVVGVNGLIALALILFALGAAILVYGIVKRQRQSPREQTTSERPADPEPPRTV